VIVVRQHTPRANPRVISNFDSALNVELDSAADKNIVTDYNAGAGMPVTIKFEVNIRLEYASAADLDLMRPGHLTSSDSGARADLSTQQLEINLAADGKRAWQESDSSNRALEQICFLGIRHFLGRVREISNAVNRSK
jgi:hypothetical protein